MNTKLLKDEAVGCELVSELVQKCGEFSFRVQGTSMLPAIMPGDIVFVRKITAETIQPGNVVLYSRNGRLFLHRFTRQEGSYLVFQGDSLAEEDAPVDASEVVGVLVAVTRQGRSLPLPLTLGRFARVLRHLRSDSDLPVRLLLFGYSFAVKLGQAVRSLSFRLCGA